MKTVLITGSSSGIGKETAKYFAEKGWNVIATMRTPEKEEELTKIENILVTKLDVLDKSTIESAIKEGIQKFGQIDVVLNNAGYGTFGPFETAKEEEIRRQFDVNLFGVFDVTKAMIPHFKENKSGLFINISSIGGLVTLPLFSLYHATKWALEGFSESLTYELRPLGIDVKIVEPGGVRTDFAGRSLNIFESTDYPEYSELSNKLMSLFQSMERDANRSDSIDIAKVIYEAATDGKKQLRYLAGEDAKEMWNNRKEYGDDAFLEATKQMLGQ